MDLVTLMSGNANTELSGRIASYLGRKLCDVEVGRFSDGEIRVNIHENIRGMDVFIIQPTLPPADNLLELLIMIDACYRASANRITAVMPYYGYARQDRKDQPRVPITAKLVANLIETAGAHRVLALELHAAQIQGFFDIQVDNLFAAPVMLEYIREKKFRDLTVVSPDVGGIKMGRAFAKRLNANLAIVDKRRTGADESEVMNVIGEVAGSDIIILDDIISTAGTITQAAQALKAAARGGYRRRHAPRFFRGCVREDRAIAHRGSRRDELDSPQGRAAVQQDQGPRRVAASRRGDTSNPHGRIDQQSLCVTLEEIMEKPKLNSHLREGAGKEGAKRLRASGENPAILYGHKREPVSARRFQKDIWHILHTAASEHMILSLTIDGSSEGTILTLVRDIQHHPVSGDVLHMDLQRISIDEKLHIGVPIDLAGAAKGVKDGGRSRSRHPGDHPQREADGDTGEGLDRHIAPRDRSFGACIRSH